MPADEVVRENLKRALSAAFNKVSGRVVQVNEMVDNFDNLAGNNLGFLERGVASSKMHELARNAPAQPGVFTDSASTYVSTDFLKQNILKAVDQGKLDGFEDAAVRAAKTTVQAVEKSADHAERVKAGQIRPKTP